MNNIYLLLYEINNILTLGALAPRQLHHEFQVVAGESILWHGLGHLPETTYKSSRLVY